MVMAVEYILHFLITAYLAGRELYRVLLLCYVRVCSCGAPYRKLHAPHVLYMVELFGK